MVDIKSSNKPETISPLSSWSQSGDYKVVRLSCELKHDAEDYDWQFNVEKRQSDEKELDDILTFSAKLINPSKNAKDDEFEYEFRLHLNGEIKPETKKTKASGNHVFVQFEKKDVDEWVRFVDKSFHKRIPLWLSFDSDTIDLHNDSDNEDPMGNMGNMGDFGGAGGAFDQSQLFDLLNKQGAGGLGGMEGFDGLGSAQDEGVHLNETSDEEATEKPSNDEEDEVAEAKTQSDNVA